MATPIISAFGIVLRGSRVSPAVYVTMCHPPNANSAALTSLDELEHAADSANPEQAADENQILARLTLMIRALKPPDAQVMLLYLEDLEAGAIGDITGLSARAVATKIHRIKAILARRFHEEGGRNDG